jgi:membrane peptidoglycan carboxypeptidase
MSLPPDQPGIPSVEAMRAAASVRPTTPPVPAPAAPGLRSASSVATGATREGVAERAPGPARAERAQSGTDDDGKPRLSRRDRIIAWLAVVLLISGFGIAAGTFYVDSVSPPDQLPLPESTTVYYADGRTPMAKLGTENRTILKFDEMNDAVKETVVAAEDQSFWTNEGIDLGGIVRAAWNNVTGGDTQGASTITQQYARIAADLKGVTYSRKLREAVLAWKLKEKYSKEEILEFYLNTVPFGRGAYGIEAAAQTYLGKTANRNAPRNQQVTVSEAMVLVAMIKQPEPDPAAPEARPGYDPTRGPVALTNSRGRWAYVRDAMVSMGKLTRADADALQYPETVKDYDPSARQSGLDQPTGLAVFHALSELRQVEPFQGQAPGFIEDGGFRIITTIDKRLQDAAVATADIRRESAPDALRGQPRNWQAALVSVEPGTGRVLAYYGGSQGTGADYAGWYYDEDGEARGFGQHPPGSSFKVYDLLEALRRDISIESVWDAPPTKEFPASGRTRGSQNGPVRNAGSAACQPRCTLLQSTVASLNVPFFDLTEQLGFTNVIDMAHKAGIDSMWSVQDGRSVRVDLTAKTGPELSRLFSTEVGIGQYGVTVADHANGLATLAAGGKRAPAHFVREVTQDDETVYGERTNQTDIGLSANQVDLLNYTLSKVPTANLDNGWDTAGKTGTWQAGTSTTRNAHVWMVGYTRALATAVWVGTTDGKALVTKDGGTDVFGANYAGPIWRQYMRAALEALKLDPDKFRFRAPKVTGSPGPTSSATAPPPATGTPPPAPTTLPAPPPPPTSLPPPPTTEIELTPTPIAPPPPQ